MRHRFLTQILAFLLLSGLGALSTLRAEEKAHTPPAAASAPTEEKRASFVPS